MKLEIFTSQIDETTNCFVKKALEDTYRNILEVTIGEELDLIEEAYDPKRDQYNADILMNYFKKRLKVDLAGLWVVKEDLYCKGMNFIFGYASYYAGAILSIYRLTSKELIEKEAIHEIGHVLGLRHCRNPCVMQFSNSLLEAEAKPSSLCPECRRKIMH
jgi:archaemetzincin